MAKTTSRNGCNGIYDFVWEMCPHCMHEVKLKARMRKQKCPNCKKSIKPCALCYPDKCNCNKCPLGPDKED